MALAVLLMYNCSKRAGWELSQNKHIKKGWKPLHRGWQVKGHVKKNVSYPSSQSPPCWNIQPSVQLLPLSLWSFSSSDLFPHLEKLFSLSKLFHYYPLSLSKSLFWDRNLGIPAGSLGTQSHLLPPSHQVRSLVRAQLVCKVDVSAERRF